MYSRSAGKAFGWFRWLLQFCPWMWWLVLRGTIIFAQQALTAVWPSAEMKIDWVGECWLGGRGAQFWWSWAWVVSEVPEGHAEIFAEIVDMETWKRKWDGKWSVVSMAATRSAIWFSGSIKLSGVIIIFDDIRLCDWKVPGFKSQVILLLSKLISRAYLFCYFSHLNNSTCSLWCYQHNVKF